MDDEERRFVREVVAGMRETPPGWVDPDDRQGKEHLRREDLWTPPARGLDPYARLLRHDVARQFRVRHDGGPVAVEESSFIKVRTTIKIRAFPTRRRLTRSQRIDAVQLVAKGHLHLDVPAEHIGRRLDRGEMAHRLTRWLLALKRGVSSHRLRILQKP